MIHGLCCFREPSLEAVWKNSAMSRLGLRFFFFSSSVIPSSTWLSHRGNRQSMMSQRTLMALFAWQ